MGERARLFRRCLLSAGPHIGLSSQGHFVLIEELGHTVLKISFAAKPKFSGSPFGSIETSVFIDIGMNHLGKSKQLNDIERSKVTLGLSVESSASHLWGAICQATLWGPNPHSDSRTYCHYSYFCSYYCYQWTDEKKLAAKGHAQGHTAGERPQGLRPDSLGPQLGLSPPCLACSTGRRTVPPGGENWFLEEEKTQLNSCPRVKHTTCTLHKQVTR